MCHIVPIRINKKKKKKNDMSKGYSYVMFQVVGVVSARLITNSQKNPTKMGSKWIKTIKLKNQKKKKKNQ